MILARSSALQRTFWFSCFVLILLQVYRPHYFLGDDNLVYWFPLVNGVGERLAQGQSPFLDPNLFGGYRLLNDPTAISLWNPLVLGLSLLANTPFYLWICDLFASVNLTLSALMMVLLLRRLHEMQGIELSEGRIAFLSLSYAFSGYALSIGACWLMFLANQASLPMILLGLLAPRQKNGIAWVTGGLVYALLVGHLSPFLYTLFFFSLLTGGLCWSNGNFQPLQRWIYGLLLALLLTSPLLIPAAQGFLQSSRNSSFGLGVASQSSVPVSALVSAYFGGYIAILIGNGLGFYSRHLIFGLASCIANGQILASGRKMRSWTRLEIVIALIAALVALWMARPDWLGDIIRQVPLFRSLRWPFRELYLFLFLAHVWMALRPIAMAPRAFATITALSAVVFFTSLAMVPPWQFSAMPIDRQLIFSGQAHAYWKRVKPLIGEGNQIMVTVSPEITTNHDKEIPYSLIGALNYPALFGVPSISGYTAQGFTRSQLAEEVPYFFGGIYLPSIGTKMMAKNPRLRAIRLVSLHPLHIDLCSAQGCQTLPTPPLSASPVSASPK